MTGVSLHIFILVSDFWETTRGNRILPTLHRFEKLDVYVQTKRQCGSLPVLVRRVFVFQESSQIHNVITVAELGETSNMYPQVIHIRRVFL